MSVFQKLLNLDRRGRAEGPQCDSPGWSAAQARERRTHNFPKPCKGGTNPYATPAILFDSTRLVHPTI